MRERRQLRLAGAICFAVGLALLAQPARALMCYEPSSPWCLNRYSQFDNQTEFDNCREAVRRFVSEMQEYIDCLAREQNRLDRERSRAVDSTNEAIRKFNCWARGDSYC